MSAADTGGEADLRSKLVHAGLVVWNINQIKSFKWTGWTRAMHGMHSCHCWQHWIGLNIVL